ncbi:hypothetical protein TanjilG_22886 [Lupinus angustifolius]|uniref:DUF241 domain protein n=1 Tax=Lupinus angustifolius TaxID=3871 RepID=A0A4P1RHS0_LUPAN|nr:PREDICTED: uncharacterized protein LOC109350386 [Lupinus angustifolius]OIW11079.1 hypothetical protein TanjilG_22886 [Lupinus angustifolius]
MSSSYIATEIHYHVRSISLPSRLQHPSSQKIEGELKRLKSWDASSLPSSSLQSEDMKAGLKGLAELYNSVHELIVCPLTQEALIHQNHHVEKPLDMSVQLLDVCGSARELLLLMKEQVLELQSALRRKGLDSSINSQLCGYICFRKKAKKDITKSIKVLKTMECSIKSYSHSLLDVDHHLLMVINVLKELSTITISFFQKLLNFMCGKNTRGWSMFSKMVSTNEMDGIDIALCSFHRCIRKNDAKVDVQIVKRRLGELDGSIIELELGLDCLFRCLIQHRVSLLNLLTSSMF